MQFTFLMLVKGLKNCFFVAQAVRVLRIEMGNDQSPETMTQAYWNQTEN